MKRFLRRAESLLLCAAVIFCCGCGDSRMQPSEENPAAVGGGSGSGNSSGRDSAGKTAAWQYADTAMGTVIQQTIYAGETAAVELSGEVTALLNRLEREELSWRLETSEVYRINASAGREEGYLLSEDMAGLLQVCMEFSENAEGAFDVTLGPVTRLWNIDEWAAEGNSLGFELPSKEAVRRAVSLCGSSRLVLETEPVPRLFLPEGMQLDLGAVGKGLALSRLKELLEERTEVTGAVISLGGSILTWGSKPDGSVWKVGIINPLDTSSNVGILSLEGQWCVSTSGDYERYVEVDGVRYHHILDPETGFPAVSDVRGVSILSKDGLLSDALSTACFILGPEKGLKLAQKYEAEALFVMADGEIVMSEGMKMYFQER